MMSLKLEDMITIFIVSMKLMFFSATKTCVIYKYKVDNLKKIQMAKGKMFFNTFSNPPPII